MMAQATSARLGSASHGEMTKSVYRWNSSRWAASAWASGSRVDRDLPFLGAGRDEQVLTAGVEESVKVCVRGVDVQSAPGQRRGHPGARGKGASRTPRYRRWDAVMSAP